MSEKIRTDSEQFQRASREQIAEWDSQGLIAWNPRNHVARLMSEQAQKERRNQEEAKTRQGGQVEKPEPDSPLDRLGIAKDERLWSGHPLTQRAIRSGDAELLGQIYADPRYDRIRSSGPTGGFTWAAIESYMTRDPS